MRLLTVAATIGIGGAVFGAAISPGVRLSRPAAAGQANLHDVRIERFAFVPARLTVRAGDTVVWSNGDYAPHTASGRGWDSGTLGRGRTARVRFATPGTYSYYCRFHPRMRGTVVVRE